MNLKQDESISLVFESDDDPDQQSIAQKEIQRVEVLRREQDEFLAKLSCEKPIIKQKLHFDHSDQIAEQLDELEVEMDQLIHQVRKYVEFVLNKQEQEDFNIIKRHLTSQPSILKKGKLTSYQLEGLNWIISMYEAGLNGILADQMGLGKTIQTIAFLAYLKSYQNISGPHLIIGPLSTIGNWERELNQWFPKCRVLKMLANQEWRDQNTKIFKQRNFDVIVTSYEAIFNSEYLLRKLNYHCLIIDEAHKLKNEQSLFVNKLKKQDSKFKLLLTGTPIQNNPHELWSLLNYLMPQLFPTSEIFDQWFMLNKLISSRTSDIEQFQNRNLTMIEKVRKVISLFMIRRTKAEVALDIPPKKEIHLFVQMTPTQRAQYKQLIIEKKLAGTKSKKPFCHLLMQLRKLCLHLYMFPELEDRSLPTYGEHLIEASGKFKVLDIFLKKLKAENHKVIIFSQFTTLLDILEDYLNFRGYIFCRIDGNTDVEEREENIQEFQKEGSDIFIFLLSTRAGGLGITLTAADTVIIYDSDFNPQCDLQAMDRVHRIGQKKNVMVYRLITKSTVEENIIERQQIKLRWEQLIIDNGQMSFLKDKEENLEQLIYSTAAQVLKDEPYTEEDIETILQRGEELTKQLNEKIDRKFQVIQKEISNQLDLGVKTIAMRDFLKDNQNVDVDQIIQQYKEEKKERKKERFSVFRKIIKLNTFQLYKEPELLQELLQRFSDCQKHDDLVERGREFDLDIVINPLNSSELEKLTELEQSGFDWDSDDFQRFTKACSQYGRNDIENIAQFTRKTADEIRSYIQVFNERFTEIEDHEKFMKPILAKEKRILVKQEANNLLCEFMRLHENPFEDIKLDIKYEGKPWTHEEDILIIYATFVEGYGEWEQIQEFIMNHDYSKFDYQLRTLTPGEIGQRFNLICKHIEKWMQNYQKKQIELQEKQRQEEQKEVEVIPKKKAQTKREKSTGRTKVQPAQKPTAKSVPKKK